MFGENWALLPPCSFGQLQKCKGKYANVLRSVTNFLLRFINSEAEYNGRALEALDGKCMSKIRGNWIPIRNPFYSGAVPALESGE